MKIDTTELYESISKLERLVDRQEIFDQADEMDLARWHQIDLENEREQMTEAALDACLKAGVADEHLRTLARETGCVRWALQNSLKG
jgi:hypothetical protein